MGRLPGPVRSGVTETWLSKMVQLAFFMGLFSVILENILQASQEVNTYLKDRGTCMQAAVQKSVEDLALTVLTDKYYIQ